MKNQGENKNRSNEFHEFIHYIADLIRPHSSDPHFFKGGQVNFKYLSQRGGIWKIEKGGISMV